MMTVLILQPIAPNTTPALRARADALLARLEGANPGMTFDICQDDAALPPPPHPSIYMKHATVRNYMLDKYLRPEHTHVLWVDSDLVEYPADLPTRLMDVASQTGWLCACGVCARMRDGGDIMGTGAHGSSHSIPAAIVAPLALLSPTSGWSNRFYDIGGFIEHGNRARMFPPWFEQQGDVIELDSVGCCYLAPATLYREGARYAPPPTDYYVEHWSVMQEAKRRGYRVVALTTVHVLHAWLPDYGMEAH